MATPFKMFLESVPLPLFLGSDPCASHPHHLVWCTSFFPCSSCFSPSPRICPRNAPGDLFQYIAFLMPSLFGLPCRPPLPHFNDFSLSGSSLVSLWSSSHQPDVPPPSLASSCPFVQRCLSSSKLQTHLSETSSGPVGQGKNPVTRPLGPLPPQLFHNTHCLRRSLGHLSEVYHVTVSELGFPNRMVKFL